MTLPIDRSILLVVPERWLRLLLRTAFAARGHDVVAFSTVAELQSFRADRRHGPPGLVFIDQNAATGKRQALDALRRRNAGVPMVLLSGCGPNTLSWDWNAVIPRPSTKDDIVDRVEALATLASPVAVEGRLALAG